MLHRHTLTYQIQSTHSYVFPRNNHINKNVNLENSKTAKQLHFGYGSCGIDTIMDFSMFLTLPSRGTRSIFVSFSLSLTFTSSLSFHPFCYLLTITHIARPNVNEFRLFLSVYFTCVFAFCFCVLAGKIFHHQEKTYSSNWHTYTFQFGKLHGTATHTRYTGMI